MPSKNPAMETNESGAPDLLAGAGDGAPPSLGAPPKPSPPEGAPGAPSATEPGPDGEILVLQTTNGATTMGLAAQPTSQSTNQQLSQLNGQAFQNGLLNLALAGALRDDDGFPLAPEEVASISSYSSVSSPEILSPRNPRTPEIPQVDFSDTQCSLVHKAEDLNIKEGFNATNQTNGVVDSSWILLGKRESVAPDSGDEAKRTAGPQDGVFDLSGAISSSQFIFTQFGKGVPSTFTSSAVTATSNTTCTTKPLPQTVEQAVSATPPAKRLKQPSLSVPHPSKVGPYELKIVAQPEEQHRARYLTEGSRGSVKDRSGSSYPTVQLVGYSAGPATLQVFVGCDSGKVKPHGFYQACKVYGKSANQFEESEVDGTQVIEIQMEPDTDMKVCIDCVGILKLRNADVEARIGPVRSKKRSNRARLVFRVQVPNGDGSYVTLQTASQPILCTQPVGQPEICRMSLTSAPYNGGVDLYLIGKNFLKGSKVIFRETNGKEETVWEKEAQIDPEFFHQMHIICTVPSYDHERLLTPRAVSVVVDSAGRLSEGYHFTYTPGPQQAETQTNAGNAANATSWQTYRVPEVVGVVHCGAGGLETKQVIKMETEPAVPAAVTSVPVHQVTMETNAAPPLPPDSLFPLVQDVGVGVGVGVGVAVQQPQSQTPPGVNTRRINSLDEDSPTSTKPTGMLMDSDPMVSSTISMGVTPPNPTAAFPLVSESSNEMAPWTEAANRTPSKSADVFVDESKVNSEPWNSDSTVTKMEVSHETYKSEDQWQNPQWTQNQTTNQWPTETAADQWTPTKTESLPVEIPKTNVWSENVQSYGDSAEPSGFENSWNSVIEVPVATNTESQWPTAASSSEPVKSEHVTFAPAQCAPEMALAPKEFTSPVAQVAPEMALAPEGFTTTYSSDQNQSSLAGATKKEAVLPLAPDNQTATVVLRNQHGGQAVLITAEDLVKDAHTILANSNNFITESGAVAAVTESSNVGASVPHQPSVTTYQPQETTNVFAPANQAPQTLNFQAANLVQQSNTVVMSPTQTINAQNPTQYVDQNSQAHLATSFAVPATIVNTTSLEQSFAPAFTNSSAPSQTVPVLISSQNTTPKTFVILTKDQVPITHVQVITAPPPSEQQVQVQQQAPHQVQVQQQQQLQQQQQVPVHNTATATSQTGYQTAVTTATNFTSGGAVGAQQQQQQSTMAFQPVLQQTTEGATSTPAPMVLGETGSGAAPSQGAQGAHPGAQQGAPAPAMKDGLSGGTLPTISFEDVCDILRDEMNTT